MNETKIPNNKYHSSPALMSDGRLFTDYRPKNDINIELQNFNPSMTNHQYKDFLMDSSDILRNRDRKKTELRAYSHDKRFNIIPNKNMCVYDQHFVECTFIFIFCTFKNMCVYDQHFVECTENKDEGIGLINTTVNHKLIPYNPSLQKVYEYNPQDDNCSSLKNNALLSFAAKPGRMCGNRK